MIQQIPPYYTFNNLEEIKSEKISRRILKLLISEKLINTPMNATQTLEILDKIEQIVETSKVKPVLTCSNATTTI